jgi:hypothetical protein
VLHQVLICFVLIHGVFANHEIHPSFNFKHKVVSTLLSAEGRISGRELLVLPS